MVQYFFTVPNRAPAPLLSVPDTFLGLEPEPDRVFRGSFRVSRGDSFSPPLADPGTQQFRERARSYRERLNVLFRRSAVRPGFVGTEVLALDG